jgi:arylsulfatase A-like enzyme
VKKHYGVRTGRYKLIHFYDDIDAWELYDLENDPHEVNNVYGTPAYKDITAELHKRTWRLREHYRVCGRLGQRYLGILDIGGD